MRLPFFRKKDRAPPVQTKSATFVFGRGAVTTMNRRYSTFADEGYAQNPVAKRCIELIAMNVGSVDLGVYNKVKGKLKQLENHPLIDLLESPSPLSSGKDLIEDLIRYRLISGSAYLLGTGLEAGSKKPPKELYLLSPDCVQVKKGLGVLPAGYEYTVGAGSRVVFQVDQISGFSPVLHFKTFNPTDSLNGLSPMIAAAYSIDQHNNAAVWNQALLQNGARPSGALVVKNADGTSQSLTDEQYNRLKQQMDDQYSGASNSGKPLLLEGGLDWREMSLSPKDMDFNEGKNSSARDIALSFGVPPQLLGIPGDNTYSNYQEARTAFWIETVLPLLGNTLDRLNRWLENVYGRDVFVWYDSDSIPALEPIRAERSKRIEQTNYMTVDEKRQAMGLEPLPDGIGEVVLVPSSDIPLDLAGSVDLPEIGSPAAINKPDQDND